MDLVQGLGWGAMAACGAHALLIGSNHPSCPLYRFDAESGAFAAIASVSVPRGGKWLLSLFSMHVLRSHSHGDIAVVYRRPVLAVCFLSQPMTDDNKCKLTQTEFEDGNNFAIEPPLVCTAGLLIHQLTTNSICIFDLDGNMRRPIRKVTLSHSPAAPRSLQPAADGFFALSVKDRKATLRMLNADLEIISKLKVRHDLLSLFSASTWYCEDDTLIIGA